MAASSNGGWLAIVLAVGALSGPHTVWAQTIHLDPTALKAVGHIDPRFQSYNVEMAEVIGARFWKPYTHMAISDRPRGVNQVGGDDALFEARPPVDLGNRRLRLLAAALGPAYMRVSGTWANSVYFQNDDAPTLAKPPDGYQGVLTRSEWRGVIGFATAVDARLVTSFAISPGVRNASGEWTAAEAKPLLDFTRSIGGRIFAAELFNEPNLPSLGAAPRHYDAQWFARDEAAFRAFIIDAAPDMRIVGPGDVPAADLPVNLAVPLPADALLAADPPPHFEIFSYHFYGAVSQRCATLVPGGATSAEQTLSEDWLARTDVAYEAHERLRDRYAPHAPIWVTETAEASCGGDPWAATFVDSFRYLDQMARLAKDGASVVFHNTLDASEYGLIDQTTLEPRPNYWAALLWRRLMGSTVLDAGPIRPHIHIYAHCLPGRPGGVTVLALNMSHDVVTVDIRGPMDLYLMTSPSLQGQTTLLNGHSLALAADGRLPRLTARRVLSVAVKLPPTSIGFITIPRAGNASCH